MLKPGLMDMHLYTQHALLALSKRQAETVLRTFATVLVATMLLKRLLPNHTHTSQRREISTRKGNNSALVPRCSHVELSRRSHWVDMLRTA